MIKMEKYDSEVEEKYFDIVRNTVQPAEQKNIVNSFRKYFPGSIIPAGINVADAFKKLILADYETIRELYKGIDKSCMENEIFQASNKYTTLYENYCKHYKRIIGKKIGDEKLNVFLVRKSGMYTCPYCNRNYITARFRKVAGAQMDHFINKKNYPIFALCLYNLVPCCSVCNLVKGTKELGISPFDPSLNDDCLRFGKSGSLLDNNLAVKIDMTNDMEENESVLHLRNAYAIHTVDLKELMELQEMYPESQVDEICKLINVGKISNGKSQFTSTDFRNMVFGKQISYKDYGKKPLAKFKHDILKELNIYN